MSRLAFRQIHLDFHTSEAIEGIGKDFSKKQFQQELIKGHISSITVFSKCHHGWAYHPSKANEQHPHLSFDLLGQQIEAAHEIGVKTPVYLSAGLDEKMARRHPEWLIRNKDESTTWVKDFFTPGYHKFCFNSPYLDYLLAQIDEVVKTYDADGIFLDIVGVHPCYCQNCMRTLLKRGKDIADTDAVIQLAEEVYANYTRRVRETIDQTKPGLRVFHNGGHIRRGRRDLADMNTHLELESLPTGGWGYDHFPLSARYAQTLGKEFLGMTGKFHISWGEFGGYKHKNALRYEAALNIANGSSCSIGDQMHPSGLMDSVTYDIIAPAYEEVEAKEAWVDNVVPIADIALLSEEAISNMYSTGQSGRTGDADAGAVRMLLEGKYLFNVVDTQEDLSKYKVIILPDNALVGPELLTKLDAYLAGGGKILATGKSGLDMEQKDFVLDFGIKHVGDNAYNPDYFRPSFALKSLGIADYIVYGQGQKTSLTTGKELGKRIDPYFNREIAHFCSHRHTPSAGVYGGAGMVEGKAGIYIAWKVFSDYADKGSLFLKEMVFHALDMLLGEAKTLVTSLPAQGVTTLMQQQAQKRYVHHLLYAVPVKRGKNVEIIEDIMPLYDIQNEIAIPEKVMGVYLAPSMEKIPFTYENGKLKYNLKCLECHQMVVIDY